MEANACIITGLSLKNPAQVLWPDAKRRTTVRPRRIESRRVTNMACLPFSGLPAPNSFDTLVLSKKVNCLVCYETYGGHAVKGSKKRRMKIWYTLQLHSVHM